MATTQAAQVTAFLACGALLGTECFSARPGVQAIQEKNQGPSYTLLCSSYQAWCSPRGSYGHNRWEAPVSDADRMLGTSTLPTKPMSPSCWQPPALVPRWSL